MSLKPTVGVKMSEFKVGEMAILCNLFRVPERNGQEVEIIGGLKVRSGLVRSTGEIETCDSYRVLVDGNKAAVVEPRHLKKLPPKDDLSDWKVLNELLGTDIREMDLA